MNYWRIATPGRAELSSVETAARWTSPIGREIAKLAKGDRCLLFCLQGKDEGYWGSASVLRAAKLEGGGLWSILLSEIVVRPAPVKPSHVTPILRAARLRYRYMPFHLLELTPSEYNAIRNIMAAVP